MAAKKKSKKAACVLRPEAPVDNPGFDDAKRVLAVVNCGLTEGLGEPNPGEFCVEAAVNYSLGYDHGDRPLCVDDDLSDFKIALNDCDGWANNKSRANGLRRLAIAQLGTVDKFDFVKFWQYFRTSALNYFAMDVINKEVQRIREEFEQMISDLSKNLNRFKSGEDIFIDVPIVDDINQSLSDLQGSLPYTDCDDYDQMFLDLIDLSHIAGDKALHILAELAIEAIEATHPKLESLKWMNKLTKKPAVKTKKGVKKKASRRS